MAAELHHRAHAALATVLLAPLPVPRPAHHACPPARPPVWVHGGDLRGGDHRTTWKATRGHTRGLPGRRKPVWGRGMQECPGAGGQVGHLSGREPPQLPFSSSYVGYSSSVGGSPGDGTADPQGPGNRIWSGGLQASRSGSGWLAWGQGGPGLHINTQGKTKLSEETLAGILRLERHKTVYPQWEEPADLMHKADYLTENRKPWDRCLQHLAHWGADATHSPVRRCCTVTGPHCQALLHRRCGLATPGRP